MQRYNITGISEFSKDMAAKGFGKPKISLQFELSQSGIAELVKAEATVEETYMAEVEEEVEIGDDEGDNETATEEEVEEEETKEEEAKEDEKSADAESNATEVNATEANATEANATEAKETANKTKAEKKKKKKTKTIKVEKVSECVQTNSFLSMLTYVLHLR
jgi:hypothetical protein